MPRRTLPAVLAFLALLTVACSSSGSPPSPRTSAVPAQSTSADPVADYLHAVNALCDGLLTKIVNITNGGSVDVPVKTYLAQWPAHEKALADFDAALAKIPVPAAAQGKAAAFAAYVRFADRLDAARLKAAHRGQPAYDREMKAEADAESDPAVTGRTTAGFADSCDAR